MRPANTFHISFDQMRLFISVMESSSFSKAAADNYIEQSTLSRQIAKLEEKLGVRLFDRSTHPICPTKTGTLLYESWKPILKEYERSITLIRKSSVGVTICTYDYFSAVSKASELCSALRLEEGLPSIDFQLVSLTANWRDILTQNKADIFLGIFNDFREKDPAFCYEKLQDHYITISMLQTNPLSQRDAITPEDLRDQEWVTISPEFRPSISENIDAIFYEHYGFRPLVTRTVQSPSGLSSSLRSDHEIALGNTFLRDLEGPHVKVYTLPIACSSLYAVWEKDRSSLRRTVERIKAIWQ